MLFEIAPSGFDAAVSDTDDTGHPTADASNECFKSLRTEFVDLLALAGFVVLDPDSRDRVARDPWDRERRNRALARQSWPAASKRRAGDWCPAGLPFP